MPEPKVTLLTADLEKDSLPQGPFDIVIASHSLNELWSNSVSPAQDRDFIERAAGKLSSDGLIFLMEPALLTISRNLILLRNLLIQDGYSVVAPCASSFPCPALQAEGKQTCHAEFFWNVCEPVSSLAAAAGLDRESVKMTFFVFSPPQPDVASAAVVSADALTADAVFNGILDASAANSGGFVTVVSDAMLNKSGRIRYLVCDGKKRFAFSAKKDDTAAAAQGFFSLRRYDKIQIKNPELRGDDGALGFAPETVIHKI